MFYRSVEMSIDVKVVLLTVLLQMNEYCHGKQSFMIVSCFQGVFQ